MRFELEWRDRRVSGGGQTPRRFLDYIVDGASLYERHCDDDISPLGWLSSDYDAAAAQRLLGHAAPDLGERTAIYVCPECADLLCGAISVVIKPDGDEVGWLDIAYSIFDYSAGEWDHDPAEFESGQELRFPWDEYSQAILLRPRPASF